MFRGNDPGPGKEPGSMGMGGGEVVEGCYPVPARDLHGVIRKPHDES